MNTDIFSYEIRHFSTVYKLKNTIYTYHKVHFTEKAQPMKLKSNFKLFKNFFNRANIKKQLYTIYFIAVLLPILIIGTFLIINTRNMLTNYHRDLLQSDNLRVKTILFEITTQVYNISEDLASNKDIKRIISRSYYVKPYMIESLSDFTLVDNYNNNYAEIDSIEIYTDNFGFMDYKQFYKADKKMQKEDWFIRAINQNSVFWMPMTDTDEYGNEYWNLCLVRKIPMADSKYNGVLVIKISDNYLKTRLGSQEYDTMVSVDRMPVFFSSDKSAYGTRQKVDINYNEDYYEYEGDLKINGIPCFVDVSTLHMYQSDSKAYVCTINDQAYQNILSISNICIAIILVAALLPAVVIHFFTDYFTDRIFTLRQAMHQVSNENYEIVNSVQGKDEVSEAFADLEVMVQNIKQKDADMYEARLNEQQLASEQQAMEFKMLASQINPHFLYNTLETIRMKAYTAGDREVATAIKLLGKSMRYVLENTGTSFTTLRKELDHVENYLKIQKLRFGDKFDSKFEISEEIQTDFLYILPLLLQPVVENAILHGMEEKETGGMVIISVYRQLEGEELLCIKVSDNGCGMTREQLEMLRSSIEVKDISRSKSIGLYNIHQRIKLNYGQQYGIRIDSMPGSGTTIRILIPYERAKEEIFSKDVKMIP